MNNISTAFRGAAGLTNEYFEALVTASLAPQQAILERARERQDTLEIRVAVYQDLDAKIGALYDALEPLLQGEDFVFDQKAASSGDTDILSARATSAAADATYTITVNNLAQAHRVRGAQQTSATAALNLSGTFRLNGVQVTVSATDSLNDIRDAIQAAMDAAVDAGTITESDRVTATIIDNYLVLEANATGTANQITASDDTGTVLQSLGVLDGTGAFVNVLQAAQDAQFNINGIDITRSSNTGLDDVIDGVTLDLAGTGTTTLTIQADTGAIQARVNDFMAKLNDFLSWLTTKTEVKSNGDGTYTRGTLANDTQLRDLRRNLIQTLFATWNSAPAGSTYTRLDQVGLELNEELQVTLDTGDLNNALAADYNNVADLFNTVIQNVSNLLKPYADGTETLVDKMVDAANDALEDQGNRVDRLERALERREELLRLQIARQFAAISAYNDQGRYMTLTLFGFGGVTA